MEEITLKNARLSVSIVMSGTLALLATGASAQEMGEPAAFIENFATDIVGLPGPLTPENTSIVRTEEGLTITLKMPTPEPGSYNYPEGIPAESQAGPEIFTGWAFIFNHPENCVSFPEPPRCGPDDFTDESKASVYNFAGHASSLSHQRGDLVLDAGSDGMIVLHGTINTGEDVYPNVPPNALTFPLENPMGAEIHASIAPHGQLDVSTMDLQAELTSPQGGPGCDCIWLATFIPPAS
jgi:hypothetical protein